MEQFLLYGRVNANFIVSLLDRYIQGAPLTRNSLATTTDELVAVDAPSEVAEAVMASADNKTAPTGPTFRARFVGQGYKQVSAAPSNAVLWNIPHLFS
uniref:Uncharacterized protein n=1 Tax=Aegilops tauschii subsp. strangulata TaxID=200361 RepID=A0A453N5W9_AEGTS